MRSSAVERVAVLGSLAAGGGNADGEVAGDPFRGLCVLGRSAGKRKDIRRLVFAAETAVEAANGRVGGQQDGDLAAKAQGGLRLARKRARCERGKRGRSAKILEGVGALFRCAEVAGGVGSGSRSGSRRIIAHGAEQCGPVIDSDST